MSFPYNEESIPGRHTLTYRVRDSHKNFPVRNVDVLATQDEIETLFTRLALADTVTVRPGEERRSRVVRGLECGPELENLAYIAAAAYSEATGWPAGFEMEIEKRIPVGGGLGGGSADAGAVCVTGAFGNA